MRRLSWLLFLFGTACGVGGRSASCQQLFACCHTPGCVMTANGSDDNACAVALAYEESLGLCRPDAGPPDAGPRSDSGPAMDAGHDSGPPCGALYDDCSTNRCCTGLACNATSMMCQ